MAIIRLYFFQTGDRPPSLIRFVLVWTTHVEYLVVFITVQNLAAINTVISMRALIFNECGLKMPFHAPNGGVWGILPLNWEQSPRPPKGASFYGSKRL